ncbi:ANKRD17, partial [Symbiodinium sp. CCMP2456]
FDECMLHGADQADCCLRVRHCKCASHPADATGCNLGVSIECATCLILIPTLILRDSGWRGIFAYTLRYLQQLSIDRLGLVLPRLPVDLL